MAEAWPPSVGARVRPVETAQVAFSPDGQPLPTSGPAWARLRWPLPSDGDDRREALVADVEDGETGRGGSANTSHARASLVWNDGSEQDDVSLALLGPCVDGQRQGSAEAATVVVRNEDEENEENDENVGDAPRLVESARRVAAASDARGAFRFRRGDFAAAAAEYVETCASLLSVVPRKHARLVLPGDEKEWNLPRRRFSPNARDDAADAADATPERDAPRPRVGARVRVLGGDHCARIAVVACVDSDDETCDVMFESTSFDGEEEEEEDAVAFARLRGFSLLASRSRPDEEAAETMVSVDLADALLNVARCHSRLASPALGGGVRFAVAAEVPDGAVPPRESPLRVPPVQRRGARLGDGAAFGDDVAEGVSRRRRKSGSVIERDATSASARASRGGCRRDRRRAARDEARGAGEEKGGSPIGGGDPRARARGGRRPRTGSRVRSRDEGRAGASLRERKETRERARRGGGAGRRRASRGEAVRGELADARRRTAFDAMKGTTAFASLDSASRRFSLAKRTRR